MQKSVFRIEKMDCPSEEQLIRMKLADLDQVVSLNFDIPDRKLTVVHTLTADEILQRLVSLNLDTRLVESKLTEINLELSVDSKTERRLLWQVLFINAGFFFLESVTGILSESMGLVADGLDMLADSIIYAMALFAVGSTAVRKKNIAAAAGYFQLALAILGLIETIRRFTGAGETPEFQTMMVVSFFALGGNALCLLLLQKSKSQEAHMKASMIFTSSDIIANLGVIGAGVLVYYTESIYPDLIVGTIVFLLVTKGAVRILRLAK